MVKSEQVRHGDGKVRKMLVIFFFFQEPYRCTTDGVHVKKLFWSTEIVISSDDGVFYATLYAVCLGQGYG